MTRNRFKSIISDKIPVGTKFIAFFGDGSGAELFHLVSEGLLLRADGVEINGNPKDWLEDCGFCLWSGLPSDFELWCEKQ